MGSYQPFFCIFTKIETDELISGGKLIIFEVTEDVLRARFAFGLLPGWWLSKSSKGKR